MLKCDLKKIIKHNLTIPNLLSVLRLIVIYPFIVFAIDKNFIGAGIMLLISGLSDMFDGMIARRFNQVTQLGKMLDPVADKLTLIAVIICLYVLFPFILPFVIIMFTKEVLMIAGGILLLKKRIKPPAARWYGKAATAIFYVSVISIVLMDAIWGMEEVWLINTLVIITTAAMVFALIMYLRMFIDILKHQDQAPKFGSVEDERENLS
ncbi:MAG: CDP-alcohol phosphatidyltransferase family protein [Acutalibacteraceae bacterium]